MSPKKKPMSPKESELRLRRDMMRGVAKGVDMLLNPRVAPGDDPEYGFVVVTFRFGRDRNVDYISNAEAADTARLLRYVAEQIEAETRRPH